MPVNEQEECRAQRSNCVDDSLHAFTTHDMAKGPLRIIPAIAAHASTAATTRCEPSISLAKLRASLLTEVGVIVPSATPGSKPIAAHLNAGMSIALRSHHVTEPVKKAPCRSSGLGTNSGLIKTRNGTATILHRNRVLHSRWRQRPIRSTLQPTPKHPRFHSLTSSDASSGMEAVLRPG